MDHPCRCLWQHCLCSDEVFCILKQHDEGKGLVQFRLVCRDSSCLQAVDSKHCESQIFKPPRRDSRSERSPKPPTICHLWVSLKCQFQGKEPSTKDLDDEAGPVDGEKIFLAHRRLTQDEDDACSYISEGEPCE